MNEKIYFVSLGCDKNRVDTEVMLGQLTAKGYELTNEETEADIIVVNTCSFIHDAKEESIETILEMAENKKTGNCKGLIVTGCLAERYREELMEELPEVDGVIGASNYDDIFAAVSHILRGEKFKSFRSIDYTPEPYLKRVMETTTQYAYLKIAEGCDNHCTYCIIPKLRGKFRSREMEGLIEEARYLVSQGKQELILVAQDGGKYGLDLYGEKRLPKLLIELAKIEDLKWIRLLYIYPEDVSEELIEVMKSEPKVLHYIDMPLQHIDDGILKGMGRKTSSADIKQVIENLRTAMPDICIRTALIVGFPGETEEQFDHLYEFLEEVHLDRVGVFTYSFEEGTPAAKMDGQIDEEVKKERQEALMELLQDLSFENNEKMIGKTVPVLIEGYIPDEEVYVGRCYKDAPNVDGMVFVKTEFSLLSGQFVDVKITSINEYDLIGEINDELSE